METRNCQNCKNDFTIEPDDFSFYEKMGVPAPTFCPECRLIRRLARRNERTFYSGKCDKCNNPIISIFSKQSNVHVYCSQCWWSDSWDGLSYGTDFDTSRTFLEQLNDLFHQVPQMNVNGLYQTKVNSDYTHMASWQKNCYMVTYSDYCENVTYGSFVNHSKDSVDNLMGAQLELCYETINCSQCYKTFFSVDCESCNDVWFSKNCTGCIDCFGCVNLKNKSHCIFNEQYSKEEYEIRTNDLFPLTVEGIVSVKDQVRSLWQKAPQKFIHGWRNVNSSGDYLNDTKNANHCFVGFGMEDCKFSTFVTGKMTDTYDFVNFGQGSSLMYEILQGGDQCRNLRMSQFLISNCNNVDYSFYCTGCQDIFGCVGLKKARYCILNKQYTKEEYYELRKKIIEHMNNMPYSDKVCSTYRYGEFFPIEISPFGYNETTAQEFFPLTREEALAKGYQWCEFEKKDYKITLESTNIPKTAVDIQENITSEIIACVHSGLCNHQCTSAFKVIEAEVQFYKRMNLPIPNLCSNCRHAERIKYRNPLKLWNRQCMCDQDGHDHTGTCLNEFKTSYAPDRPEKVYCEACYQKEIL